MKKQTLFLFMAYICLSGTLSPVLGQNWDVEANEIAFDHIKKYGRLEGEYQYELLLPNKAGLVSVAEHNGYRIISIVIENLTCTFFLDKPSDFEGNLIQGKYAFRLSQEEINKEVSLFTAFIHKFNDEKPIPPISFLDAQDSLSKSFLAFLEKLKANPKVEKKVEDFYTSFLLKLENGDKIYCEFRGDYTIVQHTLANNIDLMEIIQSLNSSGQSRQETIQRYYVFEFYKYLPLLDGRYENETTKNAPVDVDVIKKIIALL